MSRNDTQGNTAAREVRDRQGAPGRSVLPALPAGEPRVAAQPSGRLCGRLLAAFLAQLAQQNDDAEQARTHRRERMAAAHRAYRLALARRRQAPAPEVEITV